MTQLAGRVLEAALGAELTEHLGYPPVEAPPGGAGNHPNGHTAKTVKTELGEVAMRTPRDRNGRPLSDGGEANLLLRGFRSAIPRFVEVRHRRPRGCLLLARVIQPFRDLRSVGVVGCAPDLGEGIDA